MKRVELQDLLLKLWRDLGLTILFVTHDLDEAVLMADRAVVLREGRLAEILDIPLPRPRQAVEEIRALPAYGETRYRVWRALHPATVH
jgi:NitT/TauT family transport system ATP-binding protein